MDIETPKRNVNTVDIRLNNGPSFEPSSLQISSPFLLHQLKEAVSDHLRRSSSSSLDIVLTRELDGGLVELTDDVDVSGLDFPVIVIDLNALLEGNGFKDLAGLKLPLEDIVELAEERSPSQTEFSQYKAADWARLRKVLLPQKMTLQSRIEKQATQSGLFESTVKALCSMSDAELRTLQKDSLPKVITMQKKLAVLVVALVCAGCDNVKEVSKPFGDLDSLLEASMDDLENYFENLPASVMKLKRQGWPLPIMSDGVGEAARRRFEVKRADGKVLIAETERILCNSGDVTVFQGHCFVTVDGPAWTCAIKKSQGWEREGDHMRKHVSRREGCVSYYGHGEGVVVMELGCGDLQEVFREREEKLDPGLCLKWLEETAKALVNLHKRDGTGLDSMSHGDVKSANIVLCCGCDAENGRKCSGTWKEGHRLESLTAKLLDFETAQSTGSVDMDRRRFTREYVPPKVRQDKKMPTSLKERHEVDWYGFGVIMWEAVQSCRGAKIRSAPDEFLARAQAGQDQKSIELLSAEWLNDSQVVHQLVMLQQELLEQKADDKNILKRLGSLRSWDNSQLPLTFESVKPVVGLTLSSQQQDNMADKSKLQVQVLREESARVELGEATHHMNEGHVEFNYFGGQPLPRILEGCLSTQLSDIWEQCTGLHGIAFAEKFLNHPVFRDCATELRLFLVERSGREFVSKRALLDFQMYFGGNLAKALPALQSLMQKPWFVGTLSDTILLKRLHAGGNCFAIRFCSVAPHFVLLEWEEKQLRKRLISAVKGDFELGSLRFSCLDEIASCIRKPFLLELTWAQASVLSRQADFDRFLSLCWRNRLNAHVAKMIQATPLVISRITQELFDCPWFCGWMGDGGVAEFLLHSQRPRTFCLRFSAKFPLVLYRCSPGEKKKFPLFFRETDGAIRTSDKRILPDLRAVAHELSLHGFSALEFGWKNGMPFQISAAHLDPIGWGKVLANSKHTELAISSIERIGIIPPGDDLFSYATGSFSQTATGDFVYSACDFAAQVEDPIAGQILEFVYGRSNSSDDWLDMLYNSILRLAQEIALEVVRENGLFPWIFLVINSGSTGDALEAEFQQVSTAVWRALCISIRELPDTQLEAYNMNTAFAQFVSKHGHCAAIVLVLRSSDGWYLSPGTDAPHFLRACLLYTERKTEQALLARFQNAVEVFYTLKYLVDSVFLDHPGWTFLPHIRLGSLFYQCLRLISEEDWNRRGFFDKLNMSVVQIEALASAEENRVMGALYSFLDSANSVLEQIAKSHLTDRVITDHCVRFFHELESLCVIK